MSVAVAANGHARLLDDARTVHLNIGSGGIDVLGHVNIDRAQGQEAYPLDYPDGSVDSILASHILEHFSHKDVSSVLTNWIAKLKPGGKIRLAVPNFEWLVEQYQKGEPLSLQEFVMGGHGDANDCHGCIFDREGLTELMARCGLERIGPWVSDLPMCSSFPCSLNLMGFKPSAPLKKVEGVRAVMSTPRFGPLMHPQCAQKAFIQLGIDGQAGMSCFWHQKLSSMMEDALADPACRFVLTLDFDTVFCAGDVLELYRLLHQFPEADAVFPLQAKRGCQEALFSLTDSAGNLKTRVHASDLDRLMLPANSGHFGLTLFRADSLRKLPRPWMFPIPNEDGRWDNGNVDADIVFWQRFKEAGFKAFLAPRVAVGHLEEVVKWPGKDLKPVYQDPGDYDVVGIPAEVAR